MTVLDLSGRVHGSASERGKLGGSTPVSRPGRDRSPAGQARRLASAAYLAASVLGDLSAAEGLLADARRACPGAEPSAETAFAAAFVLLHGDGDLTAVHRLLLQGMEATGDADVGPVGAEEALWMLMMMCRLSGRAEHRESLGLFLAGSGASLPADLQAAARRTLDPWAVPRRNHEEAEPLTDDAEPAQIVTEASASALAGRLPACRQALRRVARPAAGGRAGPLALQAGILLALEAYQSGQWDEAWRLAEDAADVCASGGYQLLRREAQTVLALVAASRGDAGRAQALADEIARWAGPRGLTSLLAGAHYSGVLTALAQVDFPAAYLRAARISPAHDDLNPESFAAWALLDLVEAALRTDRRAEAVAHVRAALQAGLDGVSPRMALLSTAAMAMIAPDDGAVALFNRALASSDAGCWPFDRARVHLLLGERLRRMRAVTPARAHLAAAHEEFRRLGAPAWAARAATGLRATGHTRQRADPYAGPALTPQELEIARLAATGLSNKQIASRLFMSHRTVSAHLYRIFPKLGVTSRAALGSALPRDETDPTTKR